MAQTPVSTVISSSPSTACGFDLLEAARAALGRELTRREEGAVFSARPECSMDCEEEGCPYSAP